MRNRFLRTFAFLLLAGIATAPVEAQTRKKTTSSATKKKKTTRKKKAKVVKAVAPPPPTTPRGAEALANDLANSVGRIKSGQFGVMVTSLTRGDTLFAYNAAAPMMPASTMKLLSTAIAFERLGPNYQFSTDALRDGEIGPDGTLNGNIYIRGDGDPSFSGRFLGGKPAAAINRLAELVASQGIKRINGNVIGDPSAFDDERIPRGWLARYLQAGYAARVSGLSLNENLVWVTISRDGVALEPSTSALPLVNLVRFVNGSGARIRVGRKSDGTIIVSGTMGRNAGPRRYVYVVEDPAAFTTGAFRNALAAQGIQISGTTRIGRTPGNATKVASFVSPTLDRMAAAMNRESINHYAELIFRNAARGKNHEVQGTARTGEAALKTFFASKIGTDTASLTFADGSGLSTLDRVTPRAMTQLLGYAHRSSWGPWYHASLPVAGESELLRRRMRGGQAQGNLHAKTGTTNDVIGLAGYVTALDGEVIAFTFLYNGRDRWTAKSMIDRMGMTLANFSR
jgi:D-alanyl-D-alanine carboxypeptidase/D-alanyl-D-alanine-endopeptidase (penicillin-binding protein 4)